ncbi:MAG: DNA-directed DNA polymerase [Candidatus Pacearchaeota archaeon]
MEKETFITLDYDYTDIDDSSVIRLWGRTKEGKRICVIDKTDSYFWLIPKQKVNLEKYAEKVKKIQLKHAGRTARVLDVKIREKNFLDEKIKALQVIVSNPKDIQVIKDIAKEFPETLDKKEHDINYVTRYIIDKEIEPLTWYDVEGDKYSEEDLKKLKWDFDVDIVIKAKNIKLSKEQLEFKPKILAFDIEATEFEIGKGKILMISLADTNISKIITWKHFSAAPKEVEFVKNEEELIKRFIQSVKEYKPDFLVGYFSDVFDLPYIRMRADEYGLKLDLSLDKSNVKFTHGILPISSITGLVHIDLYKYINNIIAYTLQSETISLNDVAKEMLGEEKLKIDLSKITKEIKEIEKTKGKISDLELRKFSLYNLQDAVLTAKLFSKLWINIAELTKLVREPLADVSRATYSNLVEHNILHNLKKFNEISQSRPTFDEINSRKTRKPYIGAFVKEPTPGLYENIAVFDFRSFYPNIIVSFNISQPTLRIEKEKEVYETPEFEFEGKKRKFFFIKKTGFIPKILNDLLEKRKQVKHELKQHFSPILEARDYALKTLSNATYGYFGFFGARYYSPECAASIAAIARHYIHKTIEKIEKEGFKVIYADTDSVMFLFDNKQKEVLELLKKINSKLPGTMELELENFYKRGIFVLRRTGELGAKKKYALIDKNEKIKVRGFETVRRDRCELAKETQDIVLEKILKEGNPENALKYICKVITEVKDKKIPIEKLIIRTQLKKEIESYAAIGPHVTIAKHMRELGLPTREGALIEFVIAEGKEKLIRERARLPDEVKPGGYDIDYYIEHQVLPAVESIFAVFNISLEELKGKKQKSLKDF